MSTHVAGSKLKLMFDMVPDYIIDAIRRGYFKSQKTDDFQLTARAQGAPGKRAV